MATLTLQPDPTAGLDTFIRQSDADANKGTQVVFDIGEWNGGVQLNRGLIKFDLSSLPDGALISSATFSLYMIENSSDHARTLRVYRLKRAWVETQATWNVYSTGNSWQAAGGFGADDCEQTDIGSRDFAANEAVDFFKAFALTPTTKAGLDLGNGWLVKADTESDDKYRFSSSDLAQAVRRPKLVIEYTAPSGGYAAIF